VALNEVALNGMAGWLADHATYLALHSADPGSAGLNETTALRVAANWGLPESGVLTTGAKAFLGGVPLGPVTYVGLWSAPVGGTFYGAGELSGDQTFNGNGVYNIETLRVRGEISA
jgi:hypothetical protein